MDGLESGTYDDPMAIRTLAAVALVVFAPAAAAQKTHIVGPGGFKEIRDAIAVAKPGDTILVRQSSVYRHFTLDKGLTIRADRGIDATVFELVPNGANVFRIPPGQAAEVIGLRFKSLFPILLFRYVTQVIGGTVAFRRCELWSSGVPPVPAPAALHVQDAHVVLTDCILIGENGGVALLADRATVAITRTALRGGHGFWDSYAYGGAAIELIRSKMHASRMVAQGGDVSLINNAYDGGHGIYVGPESRLWITDSHVAGGLGGTWPGNRGGDGIHNVSAHAVEVSRVGLRGATGTIPGLPFRGKLKQNSGLIGLAASIGGPVLGSRYDLDFSTAPKTPLALLASPRLDGHELPLAAQPLWMLRAPGYLVLSGATTDGAGRLRIGLQIPQNSGLRGLHVWFSAIGGTAAPFQATPPVGGQIW